MIQEKFRKFSNALKNNHENFQQRFSNIKKCKIERGFVRLPKMNSKFPNTHVYDCNSKWRWNFRRWLKMRGWKFPSSFATHTKSKTIQYVPYNQFVLTRGFKNVVELSKIYSQLRPLCKFDTSGYWFREKIAKAVLSVVSVYNVVFSGGLNMSRWKWQYADKACSCLSKREKAEPSASDNCRICSCCFKTQFGNFKSGWISSENMFVAPTSTRERWNVTKIGQPSDKRTFRCPVDEGESFSTKVESALRFFRNWTRQRTMNSSP